MAQLSLPAARSFSFRPALALSSMLGLYRQRRALARLDDARLADLGLTRAEAHAEATRPLWDVPPNWRA